MTIAARESNVAGTIKLMHAKLHRVTVTEAKRNYVGSISIDANLLDAVQLLPLEEVEVVNVANGHRWRTYVLPGPAGQGGICPNGGGALLCKPGDTLIIWANIEKDVQDVMLNGHTAHVVLVDDRNAVTKHFRQQLRPTPDGLAFDSELPVGRTYGDVTIA